MSAPIDPHEMSLTLCVATGVGAFLVAVADRLRLPSIALLLLGGVLLGPEGIDLLHPDALGPGLEVVISLAVAVILFEGGLTLDVDGFRRAPRAIVRMLTVGVLITWAGASVAIGWAFDVSAELAITAGSLLVVTGPTVVSPILRRIGVRARLHHVLYWEGVVIDAIGVFIAVLCFEWIAAKEGQGDLALPLARFGLRFVSGAAIGAAAGWLLDWILRHDLVPREHVNITVLGSAFLIFGSANAIVAEAGVLSVIVAGLVLHALHPPQLERLKRFELELTELGIGVLFVLLAAKLDLSRFVEHREALGIVLFVVILVARPLNVAFATAGAGFRKREKIFLAWMAPRGIVAASMASLFTLRLEELGFPDAHILETVTFAVIGVTVLGLGLTAPLLARLLRLERPERGAWLLAGETGLEGPLCEALTRAGVQAEVVPDEERPDGPGRGDVEYLLALSVDLRAQDPLVGAWALVVGRHHVVRYDRAMPREDGAFGVWRTHGARTLWPDLGGPAELAAGLEGGRLALEVISLAEGVEPQRFGPDFRPLFEVRDGHASFLARDDLAFDGVEAVVVLRRRIEGLEALLADVLLVDRPGVGSEDIVRVLLEDAASQHPGLDVEEHAHTLASQSQGQVPGAIGGGVAIPHVYDPAVASSVGYLAALPGGLATPGPDGEPVTLVFLVVSPPDRPQEHLRSLAAVAHLGTDRSVLERLRRQGSRAGLLEVLADRM